MSLKNEKKKKLSSSSASHCSILFQRENFKRTLTARIKKRDHYYYYF